MADDWGGHRPGAGRPRKPTKDHLRDGTYQPSRHGKRLAEELELTLPEIVTRLGGFDPRRQLLWALEGREGFDDPGIRTSGEWLARLCVRNIVLFEGAQFAGKPMVLQPHFREFFNEALRFKDDGSRIYNTAVLEIPRKNAKSHTLAGAAVILGSPAEGEASPEVVLAAGSRMQAGELFDPARMFVTKSPLLCAIYRPFLTAISCEWNDGVIKRISAEGEGQYGLGPYIALDDEKHVWTQARQIALHQAIRSSFGGRDDWLHFIISTAGWDVESIFGKIMKQAREHPLTERRSDMGAAGFVLRDEQAKTLVHAYEVAKETPLGDIKAWKAANPAYWRTEERLAADMADEYLDESTKRRMYGDEWTSAENRWVSVARWCDAYEKGAKTGDPNWIPPGAPIHVAVDAAITHDTLAAAWAWKDAAGLVRVRVRVWSVRPNVAFHEFVEGGRMIGEDTAEPFIRDVLAKRYHVRDVSYDPRYFETEATHLARSGLIVADMPQSGSAMMDARSEFFKTIVEHRLRHDGDSVLAAHVGAANGRRIAAGWQIWPVSEDKPIDGLVAVVMAVFRAVRDKQVKPWSFRA